MSSPPKSKGIPISKRRHTESPSKEIDVPFAPSTSPKVSRRSTSPSSNKTGLYSSPTRLSNVKRGFLQAAKQCDIDQALRCAEQCISIHGHLPHVVLDAMDSRLLSCLHWLAYKPYSKQSLELMEWFIKNGASVNIRDPYGRTPLTMAAREGNLGVVELLLNSSGVNTNHSDRRGQTALFKAVQYNHVEVVELLLQRGANPDISEREHHNTPLHLVCQKGHRECQRLLLAANADCGLLNVNEDSPLHILCNHHRKDMIIDFLLLLHILPSAGGNQDLISKKLSAGSTDDDGSYYASLLKTSTTTYKTLPRWVVPSLFHRNHSRSSALELLRDQPPISKPCSPNASRHRRSITSSPVSPQHAVRMKKSSDQRSSNTAVKPKYLSPTEGLVYPDVAVEYLRATCDTYRPMYLLSKPMEKWNHTDVLYWLEGEGYPQYSSTFTKHHVDGKALGHLTINIMKTDLNIKSFGHRSDLLNSILHYQSAENDPNLSSEIANKTLQTVEHLNKPSGAAEENNGTTQDDRPAALSQLWDQWAIAYRDIELGDVVGKGFFGEVRKATWKGLTVAVKYLYRQDASTFHLSPPPSPMIPQKEDSSENKEDSPKSSLDHGKKKKKLSDEEKFIQEIGILSSLRHPNIINFIGWSRPPSKNTTISTSVVMVTEYMSGGTLWWLMSTSHIYLTQNPRVVLDIVRDIVRGMTYLHSRNILHRDLNSKNILMDEHYHCKISDFGLSRSRASGGQAMTQSVGFLTCMAPEVFKGSDYSFEADVYSFAMILYHLVVGEPPEGEMNPLDFARKAAFEKYRPQLPNSVSPEWERMITSVWADEPGARPSFQELLTELDSSVNPTHGVCDESFATMNEFGIDNPTFQYID